MNITCEIQGRPKNFYSIHKKMLRDHKELSEIYDLLAIRVLVDSVKDCYGTLGVVHSMWRPIPGRFKDMLRTEVEYVPVAAYYGAVWQRAAAGDPDQDF